MKKPITLVALCQEAERILGETNDSWIGKNGNEYSFVYRLGWDNVDIKIADGLDGSPYANYMYYLRLFPRKMIAVFYEYSGLPEKRKIIEDNLIARGYTIYVRSSEWFTKDIRKALREITQNRATQTA